ncbi:MAG: ABC transporter substrate-binding protein [Balneolaceae bacterium]
MKRYIILASLILLVSSLSRAQSFDEAYELYQSEKFDSAAVMFSQIDNDRAVLFAGKSYFAAGNYLESIQYLNNLLETSTESIQHEAWYTLALVHFRIKNFSTSLELLRQLLDSNNRTGLRVEAQRFYNQVLQYLNGNERFKVFSQINDQQVRKDLVEASEGRMAPGTYQVLLKQHISTLRDSAEISGYQKKLNEIISDTYHFRYPNPPAGMSYNIGAMLPVFDENEPEFVISRNLYFGILMAAEEFNSRNPDKKVFLNFKNTLSDSASIEESFTELIWNHHVDAILGPLFSETAVKTAKLAEDFRTPMLTPLANSDSINLDYNYTFQLNPTFEIHGRHLARYAVNELKLDTLAIITEANALGTASALGFRYEAEKLGAHIAYYIEENFAATGFDMRPHTQFFTPDSVLIDSLGYTPVQAIYAPFTGQAAPTLISLLLTDLEAMNSDVIMLGSAEWGNATLTESQENLFEIYYTEPFGLTSDSLKLAQFEQDFELRFGIPPNQFSRIGFDAGNFLLDALDRAGNPEYLSQVIRQFPLYKGLEIQVHFDGTRINQRVNIRQRGTIKEDEVANNRE